MTAHWNKVGWPPGYDTEASRKELVQELHLLKTKLFMDYIEEGKLPLRPGVLRVVDAAIAAGVALVALAAAVKSGVSNLASGSSSSSASMHSASNTSGGYAFNRNLGDLQPITVNVNINDETIRRSNMRATIKHNNGY